MGPLADLNELYVYNGWANGRILDAVAELSDRELWKDLGSSFPSVGATVVHLLAAEWVRVSRWEATSPRSMPDGWSGGTVADLRDRWTDVQERQRAFLGTLGEGDLDRLLPSQPSELHTVEGPSYLASAPRGPLSFRSVRGIDLTTLRAGRYLLPAVRRRSPRHPETLET